MLIPFILLASMVGLLLNMSFTESMPQPDWSLGILIAVLLSKLRTWVWVLPAIWFHDIVLYWSGAVVFPYALIAAVILSVADKRLGPGQQQRWFCMVMACTPLLFEGVGVLPWLLTMVLVVLLWSFFSSQREKVYVEPI